MKLCLRLELLILLYTTFLETASTLNATCVTDFTQLNHSVTNVQCPSGCLAQSDRCDVLCGCPYHTDGPICLAAIHGNHLTDSGGLVQVYQSPIGAISGLPEVCSVSGILYSFTVSCTTQGNIEDGVSTVTCPPGCSSEYFCGAEVYAANSSLCAAAIDVGAISDIGGTTTLFKYTSATTCNSPELFTFVEKCAGDIFTFPREYQTADYVTVSTTIPSLSVATFCFCSNVTDRIGPTGVMDIILSYAVPANHNEMFLIWQWNLNRFLAHVGPLSNSAVTFEYEIPVGINTQFCFWFDSAAKLMGLYVNGEYHSEHGYDGSVIRGGGTLLLGQEQDSVGGKFDASQSYTGTISDLLIYKRRLTAAEIHNIARNCICPYGNIVNVGASVASGQAQTANSSQCPTSVSP